MRFNSDKLEYVRYWSDPGGAPDFHYLGPDGTPIDVKSDLRDLGFQLSSHSSFDIQIQNSSASSKLVGWGLRFFRGRGRKVMLTLLKNLV